MGDYLQTFERYGFLWRQDLQATYAEFMRGNPSLEAFETELKKYMAIEGDIGAIPAVHNIGAVARGGV